jgi:hypothetical protein
MSVLIREGLSVSNQLRMRGDISEVRKVAAVKFGS